MQILSNYRYMLKFSILKCNKLVCSTFENIRRSSSLIIFVLALQVEKGFGLSVSRKLVACACNNGQVKLFSANSLSYAGSLCYPETRCSKESVADCHVITGKDGYEQLQSLPNAIACQFSTLQKLGK